MVDDRSSRQGEGGGEGEGEGEGTADQSDCMTTDHKIEGLEAVLGTDIGFLAWLELPLA